MRAALEEDAAPGCVGNRAQDRRRHGDDQRARAGNHQQRHGTVECRLEGLVEDEHRHDDGQRGHDDDAQRVLLLELVQEALRRGLLLLGVFHQLDDARQRALAGQASNLDVQRARLVERPLEDRAAGRDIHRYRLAGDGGLVYAGLATRDHAVDGQPLARFDDYHVAQPQVFDLDQHLQLAAAHQRFLGAQFDQRLDGAAAASQRIVLQGVAQREEEEQDRALAPVTDDGRADGRQHHQQVDVDDPVAQLGQPLAHAVKAAGQVGDDVRDLRPRLRKASRAADPADGDAQRSDGGQNGLHAHAVPAVPRPAAGCLYLFWRCSQ